MMRAGSAPADPRAQGLSSGASFLFHTHAQIAGYEGTLQQYPNPTSGSLTLRFANDGPHQLELCDAQGRVLRSEKMFGVQGQFDLQALPTGLYVVREVGMGAGVRVVRE